MRKCIGEPYYAHLSGETAELLSVMLNMPRLWEDREPYMQKRSATENLRSFGRKCKAS